MDPSTLLQQLDDTFQKIATVSVSHDNENDNNDDEYEDYNGECAKNTSIIKEILQRFVIICKDTVTQLSTIMALYRTE